MIRNIFLGVSYRRYIPYKMELIQLEFRNIKNMNMS